MADDSIEEFRRFHATLFTPAVQPDEAGRDFPDDARLIELARQAGGSEISLPPKHQDPRSGHADRFPLGL